MVNVMVQKSHGLDNQQASFRKEEASTTIPEGSTPQARWKSQEPARVKIWSHLTGDREQPAGADVDSDYVILPICSVYGLYSTEDMVVRYIGQTKQKPQYRLTQHFAEALRPPGRSRCHRWIRKVLRLGYELRIIVLEENCLWNEGERRWIAEYRTKHPDLMTNISDGGGGYAGPRSEETRKRMRGPKSPAHAAKIRKHVKSPEMRRKVRLALSKRNPGNTWGRGEKNGSAVLTESDVIKIRNQLRERIPISAICRSFNVSKAAISKIRSGRTWKHLGAWSNST